MTLDLREAIASALPNGFAELRHTRYEIADAILPLIRAREASVLPLLVEVMAWLVNEQSTGGRYSESREALIQKISAALDGDFARLDEAQAEREEAIERRARADTLREAAQVAESSPSAHADCDHKPGYMDGRRDAGAAIRALLPQEPTNAAG